MVHIVEVDTADKTQVRQFLDLPFRIYRNVPQWVPPLAMDARHVLDRKRNPFFRHSDAAFLLAMRPFPPNASQTSRSDAVIGRLCILDNRNYNASNKSKTAHFFLFECEDDLDASRALFNAAFDWARRRGLDHVVGPKGLTALDGLS